MALGAASIAAVLAIGLQPPAVGAAAVMFPPWWTAERSLAAAASIAPVLRLGPLPFIVVVTRSDAAADRALHAAGALVLLNPIVGGDCTATTS